MVVVLSYRARAAQRSVYSSLRRRERIEVSVSQLVQLVRSSLRLVVTVVKLKP
jgi:hypothetical protein